MSRNKNRRKRKQSGHTATNPAPLRPTVPHAVPEDEEARRDDAWKVQVRAEYLRQREQLDEAGQAAAKSFDQALLTLSAGALGLSITFLEKIASDPVWWTKGFLVAGWFCLVCAILCTLASFLLSMDQLTEHIGTIEESFRDVIDRADDYTPPHKAARFVARKGFFARWFDEGNPIGSAIDRMNWCAIVLFVVGVFLIALFSALNFLCPGGNDGRETEAQQPAASPSAAGEVVGPAGSTATPGPPFRPPGSTGQFPRSQVKTGLNGEMSMSKQGNSGKPARPQEERSWDRPAPAAPPPRPSPSKGDAGTKSK